MDKIKKWTELELILLGFLVYVIISAIFIIKNI